MLDRETRGRFASLREMRDAWQHVFHRSDRQAPAGSVHPEDDADASWANRDDAAAA